MMCHNRFDIQELNRVNFVHCNLYFSHKQANYIGGSARICTKKDTYPNGKEFVGYGIKPDIEVKRTLN
jgi:hypothetical protein